LQLRPDGQGKEIVLGPDLTRGQSVQVLAPRGVWQGSLLEPGGEWALLGCTVAPGFEYADYESGDRAELLARYPAFAGLIERLTPEGGWRWGGRKWRPVGNVRIPTGTLQTCRHVRPGGITSLPFPGRTAPARPGPTPVWPGGCGTSSARAPPRGRRATRSA